MAKKRSAGAPTATRMGACAPGPGDDSSVFWGDKNATAFYIARTTGWGRTFDGIPTVELFPTLVAGTAYSARPANVPLKNAAGELMTNVALVVSRANITANFVGVPALQYTVERSTNLTQGLGWVPISTNTGPATGLIQITDDFHDLGIPIPPVPASAFYRLRDNP